MTAFAKTIGAGGVTGLGVGMASGTVSGLAAGGAAAAFAAARRIGLSKVDDIIADALANPERARLLLAPKPKSGPDRRWSDLAGSYARSATAMVARQEGEAAPQPRQEAASIPRGPMRLPSMPSTAPAGGPASLQETLAGRGAPMRQPSRLEEAMMMRGGM